jgi:hypothetical protein
VRPKGCVITTPFSKRTEGYKVQNYAAYSESLSPAKAFVTIYGSGEPNDPLWLKPTHQGVVVDRTRIDHLGVATHQALLYKEVHHLHKISLSKRPTGRRWRFREMALWLDELIAEENADAEV